MIRAQTRVVSNDDAGSAGALGISDLLHKRTTAAVDHQDERRRPRGHLSRVVLGPDGVSLASVHRRVTEVTVGIIQVLGEGATIRRDAKKGLPVIVTVLLEKVVRDLRKRKGRKTRVSENAISRYRHPLFFSALSRQDLKD